MKVHVLTGDGVTYTIVVHAAVPAGNNSAGFTWKQALVNAGLNTTIMQPGNPATQPGMALQTEIDSILAGDVIEGVFAFTAGELSGAALTAALDLQATQTLINLSARLAAQLKWYGATRP
jgi:hypothetical protein